MCTVNLTLLDILVKVGLNEDTGLVPVSIKPEDELATDDELFDVSFEARILAAISTEACLFPFSEEAMDQNYPPVQSKDNASLLRRDAKRRVRICEADAMASPAVSDGPATGNSANNTKGKDKSVGVSIFKRFGTSKPPKEKNSVVSDVNSDASNYNSNITSAFKRTTSTKRTSRRNFRKKKYVSKTLATNYGQTNLPNSKRQNTDVVLESSESTGIKITMALDEEEDEDDAIEIIPGPVINESKNLDNKSKDVYLQSPGKRPGDDVKLHHDLNGGVTGVPAKHKTQYGNMQEVGAVDSLGTVQSDVRGLIDDPGMAKDLLLPSTDRIKQLERSGLRRTMSMRRSCRKVDLARPKINGASNGGKSADSYNSNVRTSDLPLTADVLNSLTALCFPDGAFCLVEETEASMMYFVLTDLTGKRTYATCLTYYTQHTIVRESDGTWLVLRPCTERKEHSSFSSAPVSGFLPTCLVFISQHPYYSLLKDLASLLHKNLSALYFNPDLERHLLQQTALQLCKTPVPSSGRLKLRFVLSDVCFSLHAAPSPCRPHFDLPLRVLFQHFTPQAVVQLLGSLLLQQKVILMSCHYSLLTFTAESLLHLLYPFTWHLPYVPMLPWKMLELVEAPGTFIMGCHSKHADVISMVEDVVLVYIDEGTVDTRRSGFFPPIPASAADEFCHKCRLLEENESVRRLYSCTVFSYEDMASRECEHQMEYNQAITAAALELHVQLFRGLLPYIKPEKRFFNKEKFLAGLEETERPFYKVVLDTELFGTFLKQRMAEQRDDWTMQEERTRSHHKNSLPQRASSIQLRSLTMSTKDTLRRMSGSFASFLDTKAVSGDSTIVVDLPGFGFSDHRTYFSKCYDVFVKQLEHCNHASLQAPLHLLCARLAAADGSRVQAIEHLHRLQACDSRLLHPGLIEQLSQGLTDDEKRQLRSRDLMPRFSVKAGNVRNDFTALRAPSVVTNFDKLPKLEMDLEKFASLVRLLDIAVDMKFVSRLYNALIIDRVEVALDSHLVDKVQPEVFTEFYKCLKEAELTSQENQSSGVKHLPPSEPVLKMSDTIKCPFGTGRIGLTPKRLFFLREGNNAYQQITYLRSIKNVTKTTQKSFFSQLSAINLELTGEGKSFWATVKEKQSLWYALIREMWAAKCLSEELKDASILQLAIQNVLVIDAYQACIDEQGILSCFCSWASKLPTLSYYTELREKSAFNLTGVTRDCLQHRLNPSLQETSPCTVECLLYLPGNKSTGALNDTEPLLLCGLSNGKIVIFNASTWLLEATVTVSTSRVLRLLDVGNDYVWAACFDAQIYVLCVPMRCGQQTLKHHCDAVTDLCLGHVNTSVYSSALDGEICQWSVPTCEVQRHFRLNKYQALTKITYYNGRLFCCTREELLVVLTDGHVCKVISYNDLTPNSQVPVKLDCFAILPNDELWVGCSRRGEVLVYDSQNFNLKCKISIVASGVCRIVHLNNLVWVGSKDGRIHLLDAIGRKEIELLSGHQDTIRSMCTALDRYIITGSGSSDGTVMVWRYIKQSTEC